ncbi:DNA gyrase/topoisomerase IV subunit A [Roseimaritima sediminicola]|uniref:DNA gyrase/topoisomerase IV subunit A n=1 Tax=Roseimaritima sediminicola TaxID=2662066 RepID=UPI0012983AA2|nr:DNA topoisomerase (ATP-hydrolyzing) [Roseimaritima sediminicola]
MAKRRTTSRTKAKTNGKAASPQAAIEQSLQQSSAVPLRLAAQSRYLNYSLSVITSRALPDVRDGLKPVQRRILYAMDQLNLTATSKHRKCAKVVGDTMSNYHPHGDSSIYEALVRMAQPFALRMPLVDGSGNFGSVDGDNAAAMRYTECRMTAVTAELLADLATRTVPFRANYDGTRQEPVVLPSRMPNLLVNGATGIAVGMATNIPPHNLKEVCNALLKLLKDPDIKEYQLVANDAVQGPDFPTAGQIINTKEELREIYATGQGTIKLRGTSQVVQPEGARRGSKRRAAGQQPVLQITSIPYGVNKAAMVERMSELVYSGKLPLVEEVRDLSTDEIRVDLLLKAGADADKVLAYLYKHTPLQTLFHVNLTCLVPNANANAETSSPARLGLKEILWHFLHFRLEVVTERLTNELNTLEKRIHLLKGFAFVFDVLDDIIRIIRRSDGKADAAAKILKKYPAEKGGLDAEQTDAILELRLYRLARLEINVVLDELKAKQKRAREIRKLLKDDTADTNASGRWQIVREEIETLRDTYSSDKANRRRTVIATAAEEPEYNAEDFIVAEDCHVLITGDGWIKRQKQIVDPSKSRLRSGDSVLACIAGSTRHTLALFSSLGVCYTVRFADIPQSTGFGEPVQKLFKLKDGERIIAALSLDPRVIGDIAEDPKKPELCPETHALAVTDNGFALRFGLEGFVDPSTRSGRRFARPAAGAAVLDVRPVHGTETVLAVSENCRAMVCPAEEVNYLSGPGKGVTLLRLAKGDRLLGFKASEGDRDLMVVKTNRGAKKTISTAKYRVTSRGGRGTEIQKNGKIAEIVVDPPAAPAPLEEV